MEAPAAFKACLKVLPDKEPHSSETGMRNPNIDWVNSFIDSDQVELCYAGRMRQSLFLITSYAPVYQVCAAIGQTHNKEASVNFS